MRRNQEHNGDSGISISVPIPAQSPKLYGRKATDDVLRFLSTHRFEEFGQRELARHIDYSESAVRRAVEVLEANDLVVATYSGTQKSVNINRSRLSIPEDPILRIPQEEFHVPVETATEWLKRELDSIVGIVLHGSVARGDADRRSDIDLWVVVQDNRAANQRTANTIQTEIEDRGFNEQRYDFHITVESIDAIPGFAEDISNIIIEGLTIYNTENFEKLQRFLAHSEFDA